MAANSRAPNLDGILRRLGEHRDRTPDAIGCADEADELLDLIEATITALVGLLRSLHEPPAWHVGATLTCEQVEAFTTVFHAAGDWWAAAELMAAHLTAPHEPSLPRHNSDSH